METNREKTLLLVYAPITFWLSPTNQLYADASFCLLFQLVNHSHCHQKYPNSDIREKWSIKINHFALLISWYGANGQKIRVPILVRFQKFQRALAGQDMCSIYFHTILVCRPWSSVVFIWVGSSLWSTSSSSCCQGFHMIWPPWYDHHDMTTLVWPPWFGHGMIWMWKRYDIHLYDPHLRLLAAKDSTWCDHHDLAMVGYGPFAMIWFGCGCGKGMVCIFMMHIFFFSQMLPHGILLKYSFSQLPHSSLRCSPSA